MMMRPVLLALGLTIAGPAGAATAQSLDCTHPSGVGCFEFTITGGTGGAASPGRITGFAKSFGSDAQAMWYTQLVEPGGASTIMLMYSGAGLPPVGDHQIADFVASGAEAPPGAFVASGSVDPQTFMVSGFHSVAGTLVIASSTPKWVEGTFSFGARESASGQMVTVDGRFKAMNEEMDDE